MRSTAASSDTPEPASLPDVLAPGLSVVFCGINPAAAAAAVGHSFSHPSNRFWRILHGAGFTPRLLASQEDRELLKFRLGLTAAVGRATRSAGELSKMELVAAIAPLRAKIEQYKPRTIAFLGKPAFAAIQGSPRVDWGPQTLPFGGAKTWVVPNPSGLNRNFSLIQLIECYSALREAAFGRPSAATHKVGGRRDRS
jgi:TDG/mug DNA glycosylase family protein